MNKTEAKKAITRRNKARKNLIKYRNMLWKCKFASPNFNIYKKRLKDAEQEIKDSYPDFIQALKVIL